MLGSGLGIEREANREMQGEWAKPGRPIQLRPEPFLLQNPTIAGAAGPSTLHHSIFLAISASQPILGAFRG